MFNESKYAFLQLTKTSRLNAFTPTISSFNINIFRKNSGIKLRN